MKQKMMVLFTVVLMLSVVACGKSGDGKTDSGSLKLEGGVLSWEADEEAESYQVEIGEESESVDEPSFDLTTAFKEDGAYEVTVRAVLTDDKSRELGSMTVTAELLEKPRIGVQGTGQDMYFIWNPVEGASGYYYEIDDNGIQEAEEDGTEIYQIPITNSTNQSLRVIARGTSEGTKVICSSESIYVYQR